MKKILSILLLLLVPFLLIACDSKEEKNEGSYSFKELANDLKKEDKNLEINRKDASMIGATEGYGYVLKSCTIEVYKYDVKSSEYRSALKEQKISMPSMDMKFDAVVRNSYAYLVNDGNCDSIIKYLEKLN